ncbi:MAG: hypothetical protein JWL74_1666 [Alphaproteobacteria bacterium]|nr:hypothetical protein [Alphaproteobacteria bacterium]
MTHMRKLLLLAAAAAAAAPALAQQAPALAQQEGVRTKAQVSAPPAARPLQLTAAHRAAIAESIRRGRLIAAIDRAGAVTTRDMLTRLSDPGAAGVVGWVAEPEGNAVTVTYYAREGDNYAAVYRSQMLGGRAVSPQLFEAGSRPALTGNALRMARAHTAVGDLDRPVCGGGSDFNTIILPPQSDDASVLIYRISPRMAAERVPAGGHYRTEVAADGTVGETVALADECTELRLTPATAGQRPRPLVANAREAEIPGELFVFLSLWSGRPLAVATGTGAVRMWGVTGEGIGELAQGPSTHPVGR